MRFQTSTAEKEGIASGFGALYSRHCFESALSQKELDSCLQTGFVKMVGFVIVAGLAMAALAFWWDFESWQKFGQLCYFFGRAFRRVPKDLLRTGFPSSDQLTCVIGTGGTPPTFQGYFKIRRWGLYLIYKRRDLLDVSEIPDEGPAYLTPGSIPQRAGDRPKPTRWALPQRQHKEPITPKAHEHLFNLLPPFATKSPGPAYIRYGPSKTEGGTGPAIYVQPNVPTINPVAHNIFYEIAHVHPNDNSLHVYVSPKDARAVIEAGWGERFTVNWIAPESWIMVYAPRNEEEVRIVRKIVWAGVCFAVGEEVEEPEEALK
ncbi:hypothetical protein P154DRAFT_532023 [Amniculicola lignicola CBS 123094]|uniref:Luciferase domain-containing protein n=1 Tax=Amniculicola lignicola CBS 123094 TaxID=1392246 RepID=A0A6A5WP45_9PLEO|nr:hypothetical protein P154DRAFT_532023 [Amniculicola lignicola CBS 123094]